ncbi:MAG TPA: 4Fe-4S binding protein [Verrucomicrobiae bacterium]|nr:4Fe-4S binding protein [Verrucomicrobiae bacterium]
MRFWPAKRIPSRGPTFDARKCTGCGDCVTFCQSRLLSQTAEGCLPLLKAAAECPSGCRTCARVCAHGAATFEDEEFFIDYLKRRLGAAREPSP